MITSATIHHYKSISEARIEFGAGNIIVGPNGVGKSNIVDALYFLHDAIVDDLDTAITKRHGIESIRQWSKTRPYHIVIDLSFSNRREHGRYRVTLASARGTFRVVEELGEWTGRNPFKEPPGREQQGDADEPQPEITRSWFSRGEDGKVGVHTEISQAPIEHRDVRMEASDLFTTLLAGPFFGFTSFVFSPLIAELKSFASYSIYPNTLRQPQVISKEGTLDPNGSNLATVLKRINSGNRDNKAELLSSIQIVLPIVSDIIVRSAGGYYVPIIRVKESTGDTHELNMSQASDGTLRILGLLTAFYQPEIPRKIAMEEPEQMIHPGILPVIADAAKEYVSNDERADHQLFITTHSPSFLDLFDPSWIIWATFDHGVTECGRIGERQLKLVKEHLFSPGEILVSEGFFE